MVNACNFPLPFFWCNKPLIFLQILRSKKDGKGAKQLRLTAVVHVLLVQARSVIAMDGGTSSDPYCKVTLGKEKAKTKVINNTLNPKWREAMDLFWYIF